MVGKGTITMRETRILEFKETITNTFLKTVSAFSNYNGGTILFGVDDNGNVKGLPDVKQACLDIENKINDSISPQPNYTLEIQNNDQTIKLTVKSGLQKPYLYKSKAIPPVRMIASTSPATVAASSPILRATFNAIAS